MKTLTRTDFLIQFVWQYKADEIPKTDEERQEKLKTILTAFADAEKKYPANKVAPEDLQKELDAASRKKSEQIDAKISAAGAGTAPASGPGGAVPGVVPPAGNVPAPAAAKPGGP
jgi:type IV pilus assembly protein PilM